MGNTISENKAAFTAVTAAALSGITYMAYKSYKKQQEDQPESVPASVSPKKAAKSIEEQIQKFKSQVDVTNPTLQDVKKLFTMLSDYGRNKTLEFSDRFKFERRKRFPKERRFSDIGDYFRFTTQGLVNLKKQLQEFQKEQQQLTKLLGINQAKFAQYASQLGSFMQELVLGDITLQNVKRSLQLKTQYLQTHGERTAQALIQLSTSLSLQEKQRIPAFLNIIISDQAIQHQPQLDKEEFDIAYEMYKNQIAPELAKFERQVMQIMGRLQTAMMGDEMGGMGGYGGYGPPEMYQQGGQGFDPMGGMNEQMMMQQLQQLRIADPQAYDQLMLMMQAQMGR